MDWKDRYWAKVAPPREPGGCREWRAARNKKGYGKFIASRSDPTTPRTRYSHRIAWILAYGPIPRGMWVLHHCDNPPCCEATHLFLGTTEDNQRDSSAKGRTRNGSYYKTHCPRGHEYAKTAYEGYGVRVCRICKREQAKAWYYRHGGSTGRRARRAQS